MFLQLEQICPKSSLWQAISKPKWTQKRTLFWILFEMTSHQFILLFLFKYIRAFNFGLPQVVNAITTPSCQHKATFITDYYLKVLWRLLKAWNSFSYLKQKCLIKFPDPSSKEQNKATSISHTSWNKLVGVSKRSLTLHYAYNTFLSSSARIMKNHKLRKQNNTQGETEPNETDTKLWPQSMLNLTNLVLTSEPTTAMCKDSRKQRR